MTQFSCTFEADLDLLSEMRQFIQDAAGALSADPDTTADVVLATNEMFTNIIVHGYQGRPGTIELEVWAKQDTLLVCLRDEAPPFDPHTAPLPDLTLPIDQRPLGKLGVYLTMKLMDEVIHQVTPRGGNELTLIKKGIIKTDQQSNHQPRHPSNHP